MKLLMFISFSLLSLPAFSSPRKSYCEQGGQAFSESLHPILMQKCAQCHGDGGYAAPHAVSNVRSAYAVAKKFTNFPNFESSRFYQKVRSAHWREYSPTAEGMTLKELELGLNEWWNAGESNCPAPYSFETNQLKIAKILPHRDSGKFQILTWDLGKNKPSFEGCFFSIDIQIFTTGDGNVPQSYRVRNPRIRCQKGLIKIAGVRILFEQSTQSYENIYDEIEEEINNDAVDKILSSDLMIIIPSATSQAISVGLRELKWIERLEL